MALKSFFTTDEEFGQLEDRDATTNIIGYIDSIIAPYEAGKEKEILFKFTVSNDIKRIEVLIWDLALINKHMSGLLSNRVIEINDAYCRAVPNPKKREVLNLVPFEIIIKEYTNISFLGYYNLKSLVSNEVQKVTFDDIHKVEGLIGYVRSIFSLTHNRKGNMTYGLGAITDKTRKITVQVKQFLESKLELGDHVNIRGLVDGQDKTRKITVQYLLIDDHFFLDELITIMCESMNDIKLNTEEESLPLEEIRRGNRPARC
ncbi:hypothetical protein TSAR_014994 [Trichomalopsis sarcophagae]|uniref:OB domain-containing protein n=1 Tax=Trichomalopsis sarcophagae TaxID=543379 RepID=A0A232EXB8_9HYME|nr:hypothetical protein TSAR_014994 [Trichomalopsis sarcophagae]